MTHKKLDAILSDAPSTPKARAQLRQAILDVPHTHRQKHRYFASGMDWGFLLPRAAGLVGAGVLGFYIGVAGLLPIPGAQPGTTPFDLTDMVFNTMSEEPTP